MDIEQTPATDAPDAGAGLAPPAGPSDVLLAALAQISEGVIVADARGRITFVNDAAARLHGVAQLHVGPDGYTDAYDLLTEDGVPYPSIELPLARAVLRGETVIDARWRIRHPDGREVPVVGRAQPLLAPDGAPMGAVLTMRDDSARAAAEAALRERDALTGRLRAAFEQSPISTVVYDAAGRPIAANPAFERLWGATLRDIPADYSVLADPQLEAAGVQPLLQRAFAGEALTMPPLRYAMQDTVGHGRVLWTEAHLYPVRDASGAVEEVVLTHDDVTDREEADAVRGIAAARAARLQELSAALSRASSLAEVAQAVVAQTSAVFAAAGTVIALLTADGQWVEVMGATAMSEETRTTWQRIPLDAPVPLAEVARGGQPVFLESREEWATRYPLVLPLLDASGHHASAVLPLVVDGRVLGAPGIASETSRRFDADERALALAVALQCAQALERARLLEAERVARASAEAAEVRLRDVFEQAPVAVAVMEGPAHVYTIVSPRYAASPGNGRPLLGRAVRDAFTEIVHQGYLDVMDEVYATGTPYFGAERRVMIDPGGGGPLEERYFNVGYQPLRDAGGVVYAIASVSYDVTEQVHARRAVDEARAAAEAARAEAEAANQAKSQFLAVMSHELRTPLNAIGGYAELIALGVRGPVTELQHHDLARIQVSQRHLLGLINEVLNYAKLETGTVQYALAPVSVRDALASAEALVAPQARARGHALRVVECPPTVLASADPEKLRQILVNLLSNAIKFTPPGGEVLLTCEARADDVRIHVRDTGIGIPDDKRQAIFEPFVQVRADLTRTTEGTGLGLAISRDLARGMGGELTVESTLGAGSTFTVTLPAA